MAIFKYLIFMTILPIVACAGTKNVQRDIAQDKDSILIGTTITFEIKDASVFNNWASDRPGPFIQNGIATLLPDNGNSWCRLSKTQIPSRGWERSHYKNGDKIVIRINSASDIEIWGKTLFIEASMNCWKPGDIFETESSWTISDLRANLGSSVVEIAN